MSRNDIKRQTDQQIISEWIGEGERVLDLGCGRGILLEHLLRTKHIRPLGVDVDLSKVQSCIRRGVPVYHGDADTLLQQFGDHTFDWVILSRTVQELQQPGKILAEALRVGSNLAVGFVNHGYWLNRWHMLRSGSRPTNEVFPLTWDAGCPYNPVTIKGFEAFVKERGFKIRQSVFLRGDWMRRAHGLPNLRAGYALYHLTCGSR